MKLTKAAVIEGMKEYDDWRRKHPGKPATEPVREQIAKSSMAYIVGSRGLTQILPIEPGGDIGLAGKIRPTLWARNKEDNEKGNQRS